MINVKTTGLRAKNKGKKRGIEKKKRDAAKGVPSGFGGFIGLLFCGDEACDNREDHKRAADEHADNLHGFAVLDALDKLVEFFKVEVLFKPVFAADLQNTAEC